MHKERIDKHDDISKYVARKLVSKGYTILKNPKINTPFGIRKPGLIATKNDEFLVLDAEANTEQLD